MIYLMLSIASFVISLITVYVIKQRFREALLDIPNERSSHTQPTPRGGGLGFMLAFFITSVIATSFGLTAHLSLWLVLIPLTIIGILDDKNGVSAKIRYLVQLFAASVGIFYFGSFFFPIASFGMVGEVITIGLTAIAITALINFYNFMDGLDGLVAGCSIVQLSFLAIYLNQPILWLLVGGIGGFCWWNWAPAKIFMGDAGSTVLGATVAIALLLEDNPVRAWTSVAITLPLVLDAVYTLCRRLQAGENIFQAHGSHLYQRLQKAGYSHSQVASGYICANLMVALSISIFGATGAIFSLIALICAIVVGEKYLSAPITVDS
ncbi:MAG: glycosyltransferase family 4 protein [Gomphosphaeria aponina SAG 52.96 = DSM 107014]|uniref:Glycosyltransferase family 4 protein n=1 Tax=Gomphosphaeria aponina SAG 52.96 = DSM 107014 TaxID=1521640 RepID=A0A941JLD4_9CHRO|nr:glycosyltransferase family 4 protein [Gomphosphaeria aponina SAG 52.96 = DSM 107014]